MDIVLEYDRRVWRHIARADADPKLHRLLDTQLGLYNERPENYVGTVQCIGADGKRYLYYSQHGIRGFYVETTHEQADKTSTEGA